MAEKILLQYQTELDLPIFIRLDLSHFNSSVISFLSKLHFSEVSLEDSKLNKIRNAKVLDVEIASNRVADQIEYMVDSDRFGEESIVPKDGYQVYRYKGSGMIIYSLGAREWTLGCLKDFGSDVQKEVSHKIIINRFLSWALSSQGMVGFWGVPIDEGIVVMKAAQSSGEAVFIDLIKKKIISIEGITPLKNDFKVIRLNKNLRDRDIKMNSEELLSFLSSYCTYFDFSGQSRPVRQMLKSLSRFALGVVHPKDKFQPRVEL